MYVYNLWQAAENERLHPGGQGAASAFGQGRKARRKGKVAFRHVRGEADITHTQTHTHTHTHTDIYRAQAQAEAETEEGWKVERELA